MAQWYADLESKIFTIVQYHLKTEKDAPFPKLKCTTASSSDFPTEFPTLYLHELSPLENNQDMENDEVISILHSIEIQVFSNKSESEVRSIMASAIDEMKKLRYSVTLFPDPTTTNKVSSAVARFRRTIAKDDVL